MVEYSLEFDEKKYTVETVKLDGYTIRYRSYENIVYVKKPISIQYQVLNIYVPEMYYEKECVGTYNLKTAPIFFPNAVGGYMPCLPEKPGKNSRGETNATLYALIKGYIIVSPGVRGRSVTDELGKYIGVAPACIVDLKSAIRYLRFNKNKIPGNVEKIISNGTSAGGALSSLLGVTGNHPEYERYFTELGAADERDDIFAASCYCPITNLEHADMAYEWEFYGLNEYHRTKFEKVEGEIIKKTPIDNIMTDLQINLSAQEKALFPEYINGLGLMAKDGSMLTLDSNGNGSFKEYLKIFIKESAQKEIEKGTDLTELFFLKIENGRVVDIDFHKFTAFRTRMKETPAFDNISMGTPENELFGTIDIKERHFTEFSRNNSHVNGELAEDSQIKLMNPMNYIGDDKCATANNFRIRHGSIDRDTSLAISVILATSLRNYGIEVDYHLPWGISHAGDYDLDELFSWIEKVCAEA